MPTRSHIFDANSRKTAAWQARLAALSQYLNWVRERQWDGLGVRRV